MNLCVNYFDVYFACASGSKNRLERASAIMRKYCTYATKDWCMQPLVLLHIGENKVRNSTLTICTTAKFYCEWQCASTSFSLYVA